MPVFLARSCSAFSSLANFLALRSSKWWPGMASFSWESRRRIFLSEYQSLVVCVSGWAVGRSSRLLAARIPCFMLATVESPLMRIEAEVRLSEAIALFMPLAQHSVAVSSSGSNGGLGVVCWCILVLGFLLSGITKPGPSARSSIIASVSVYELSLTSVPVRRKRTKVARLEYASGL